MDRLTRFAALLLLLSFIIIIGCSSGDGDGTNNPPQNQLPTVTITSVTPDTILANESITFTWSGDDTDGYVVKFYAGLDDNLTEYLTTTATYSGFIPGETHTFKVIAEDDDGAQSNPQTEDFAIYDIVITDVELTAFGLGITDADGDGFWSDYCVKWSPYYPSGPDLNMYLNITIREAYGTANEVEQNTDIITRSAEEDDTLTFTLPTFTKNQYDIKLKLYDDTDSLLSEIDYDAVGSLSSIGLEQFDGFNAWFDNSWTDNAVDENSDNYYESIEIWYDVDANLDAGRVKVIIYERNSNDEERYLDESFVYEVEGLGNEDANGFEITAGTTFDDYDYRLELLDEGNQLLDEIDYGENPELMDIPLGNPGGPSYINRIKQINK